MAVIDIQGFDKFGPANVNGTTIQNLLQQEFTSCTTPSDWTIQTGLSSTGFCLANTTSGGAAAAVSKTLSASYGTFYFGCRMKWGVVAGVPGIGFLSGATNAFAVWINATTGTISVGKAGIGGTALGTSTATVSVGSIHYIEGAVTLSTSGTGTCTIYLDGVSILSLTSQTFGATTMNTYTFFCSTGTGATVGAWDDFYLFDGTGGTNNTNLLTNPRVETRFPTSDSSVAFSFGTGTLGIAYAYNLSTTTGSGANTLWLRAVTPPTNCTISSINVVPQTTNGAANLKPCIYTDSGGAAHTLLTTGSQVTGTTSGVTLNLPVTTPQSLTGGTQYWIGFITDTNVNYYQSDASNLGFDASNTYGSGAPGTAPAMTSGLGSIAIWGGLTAVTGNWPQETNNPSNGLSYNTSSTVSQEDYFGFPSLSVTPNAIYTVKVTALFSKSDSGARTANIRMNSAGTKSSGSASAFTPATSWGYFTSFYDTDPNTSAAWGTSGLNAATTGYQVNT